MKNANPNIYDCFFFNKKGELKSNFDLKELTYFSNANYIFFQKSAFSFLAPRLHYQLHRSLANLGAWNHHITPGFFKISANTFAEKFFDQKKASRSFLEHEAQQYFWALNFGERLPYENINLYQFINFINSFPDIFIFRFTTTTAYKNSEPFSFKEYKAMIDIIKTEISAPLLRYNNYLYKRASKQYHENIDANYYLGVWFKEALRTIGSRLYNNPLHDSFDNQLFRYGVARQIRLFFDSLIILETSKLYEDSTLEKVNLSELLAENQNPGPDNEKKLKFIRDYFDFRDQDDGINLRQQKVKVVKATDTFTDQALIDFFGFYIGKHYLFTPYVYLLPKYVFHFPKENPVLRGVVREQTLLDALFNFKEVKHDYKIQSPFKSQIATTIDMEVPYESNPIHPFSFHIDWVATFVRLKSNPFFTELRPESLPPLVRPSFRSRFVINLNPPKNVQGCEQYILYEKLDQILAEAQHERQTEQVMFRHIKKMIDGIFVSGKQDRADQIRYFCIYLAQILNVKFHDQVHSLSRRLLQEFVSRASVEIATLSSCKNYDEVATIAAPLTELLYEMLDNKRIVLTPKEQMGVFNVVGQLLENLHSFEHLALKRQLESISASQSEEGRKIFTEYYKLLLFNFDKKFNKTKVNTLLANLISDFEAFFDHCINREASMIEAKEDLLMLKEIRKWLEEEVYEGLPKELLNQFRARYVYGDPIYRKAFSVPPTNISNNVVNQTVGNQQNVNEDKIISYNNIFTLKNIQDQHLILKAFANIFFKLKSGLDFVSQSTLNKINSFIYFISLHQAHNFSEFMYVLYDCYFILPRELIVESKDKLITSYNNFNLMETILQNDQLLIPYMIYYIVTSRIEMSYLALKNKLQQNVFCFFDGKYNYNNIIIPIARGLRGMGYEQGREAAFYVPSKNWIINNFMIQKRGDNVSIVFPIGLIIQENIIVPIDRFINNIFDYIVNRIVTNIIIPSNNYIAAKWEPIDRELEVMILSLLDFDMHAMREVFLPPMSDELLDIIAFCRKINNNIIQPLRTNFYYYLEGCIDYYNNQSLKIPPYFSITIGRFLEFYNKNFNIEIWVENASLFYDFGKYFILPHILREVNTFYLSLKTSYLNIIIPKYLDVVEKLTPVIIHSTKDLQLYFFFFNILKNEINNFITGADENIFTKVGGSLNIIIQDFWRDIVRGFRSTQRPVIRSEGDNNVEYLYPPRYHLPPIPDENLQVLIAEEVESAQVIAPTPSANNNELSSNIEPSNIEIEAPIPQPQFSSRLYNYNDQITGHITPYKSIESLKIISFQDMRRIDGFLFRSRRLRELTYFNFGALNIEKLMPKVWEDLRTEDEKRMEPYRPLVETSDAIIRDTIIDAIRTVTLLFKNLICSTTEKRFSMEFVDLAQYVSDLAIDCLLKEKLGNAPLPNLNESKSSINEIDALIYKILKQQNLEPQIKPVILKFLYQKQYYNIFGEVIKSIIKLSIDDFFRSYLYRVEDRFPFLGSPLNYFTADVKLRVNEGLTYAFRLIGVKNNFAQISVFNGKSFISLINDMTKSSHQKFVTECLLKPRLTHFTLSKKRPKFICQVYPYKTAFSGESFNLKNQVIVNLDTKVCVVEEYLNKYPYQGEVRIIFGDDKPVQKFTQLTSYKQFLNPALRSLLQFDFGFIKIDYSDVLKGNFLTQKNILNVNYKINIDKSFSSSPKFQILFNNTVRPSKLTNFVFPDFLEKTDYYLRSIGDYMNNSVYRLTSHQAKMKELFSDKNILKKFFIYGDRNFIYGKAINQSNWDLNKYVEKYFKLSASWVKAYRDHEIINKLNKDVYMQLLKYGVVDHVYCAPTGKRLEPLKFKSQYRYMMSSQNFWPSLHGGYSFPSFVVKDLESRFFKVFEYAENIRSSSLKNLDFYLFKRDYDFLSASFDLFEDFCIHFTGNMPVKFFHKSLYSSFRPLKTNIASRELNTFYRNFKQCISNIIANPTEASGFVMYPLPSGYSVPIFKLSRKIKNSWENIYQKSLPFYKDFNGYLQGFDVCSYIINVLNLLRITLNDKDRRIWTAFKKVRPTRFFRLSKKKAGIPLIHPDIRAPYKSFTKTVKNRTIFKFDTILIPNQVRKPYYHRRYNNIFAQYLWSKANKYKLKPMIIASPNEQIEFSHGNILNLSNSFNFKQANLLQTQHQLNAYFSIYKVKNFQNKVDNLLFSFINSLKSVANSIYNLNNPKSKLINIKTLFHESKYWNSGIILWHIQNNKLFCHMFASNYNARLRMRITYTSTYIPTVTSQKKVQHAGVKCRFDHDLYDPAFIVANIARVKSIKDLFSYQHKKFDSFKWFYFFQNMKRLNKLDLIKIEGYKFDIPKSKIIEYKRLTRRKLPLWCDAKNPLSPRYAKNVKLKKKIRELYRPDPFITTLKNKTIIKSFNSEGLDYKIFRKFNSSVPAVVRENKHITSLPSDYIKKLDQTQPLAIPNIEQRASKLIDINKKEFDLKKSVLLEFYNRISDLLKNENYSWITFHEYREELIRNETTSFPIGIFINLFSSMIQASILTFVLFAADYRRAPTKWSASFLLSLKVVSIFCFFTLGIYTLADITGFDALYELFNKTEFFSGIQKLPQNIMKPFQINNTSDDFDASAYRTAFYSKKQATWHNKKFVSVLDCTFPKGKFDIEFVKSKAPVNK